MPVRKTTLSLRANNFGFAQGHLFFAAARAGPSSLTYLRQLLALTLRYLR